ncbi:MAG: acetate uptake transporter [Nitrososphaerota archaeon]|nr:acetate uptake transporter [Nitrososphaerota archaeon]
MKADVVLANPAPLGLFGFGMTTILLNLANANVYALSSPVLAMGIFFGGFAQIVAGLLEFRKGNTFGMTAFLSYGFFWESFVFIFILPGLTGLSGFAPSANALGYYLFFWGVFTLLMFIGTLRLNGALMAVFGTLWILFFLLAAGFWTSTSPTSGLAIGTGYEGILCGLLAMYTAIANVLNEVYGKSVLPLWPAKPKV